MKKLKKVVKTQSKKHIKLSKRVNSVIHVCGRKFQIGWGPGDMGGQFHTVSPITGGGLIVVGDGPHDEYYQLATLIHEILEAILAIKERRIRESDEKIIFVMDHDQYTDAILELTRSLLDTGLIHVKESGDDAITK